MKFNIINSKKYFQLLKGFIIFQPIIDILTFLMIHFFEINITLGIVIRMLFMLLSLLYISFGSSHKRKYVILLYLTSLFLFLGIHLIVSFLYKPVFYLVEEVQWMTKISYFIVIFIALFLLVKEEGVKKVTDGILGSIYLAMTIMAGSIWISVITRSSTNTYEWVLNGYKGWFYSGNEISAIIAISFPLTLIYSINQTRSIRGIYYWITPVILAGAGFLIGTKVGFLSVSVTLIISLVILIITYIIKRGRISHAILFITLTVLALAIFAPLSPGIKNITVDMPVPEKDNVVSNPKDPSDNISQADVTAEENEDPINESNLAEEINVNPEEVKQLPSILDSKIVNKLLSSRHFYFTRQYFQFTDANMAQKLFGMGYSGNYTESPKTIEMDLLDIFFSFGIVGSLIIFLPFLTSLYFVARFFIKSLNALLNYQVLLLCLSLALGIGVSIIAGHIMFAPAVSLYFSVPIVLLLSISTKKLEETRT